MCQMWLYKHPEHIIGKTQWQQDTRNLQQHIQLSSRNEPTDIIPAEANES